MTTITHGREADVCTSTDPDVRCGAASRPTVAPRTSPRRTRALEATGLSRRRIIGRPLHGSDIAFVVLWSRHRTLVDSGWNTSLLESCRGERWSTPGDSSTPTSRWALVARGPRHLRRPRPGIPAAPRACRCCLGFPRCIVRPPARFGPRRSRLRRWRCSTHPATHCQRALCLPSLCLVVQFHATVLAANVKVLCRRVYRTARPCGVLCHGGVNQLAVPMSLYIAPPRPVGFPSSSSTALPTKALSINFNVARSGLP